MKQKLNTYFAVLLVTVIGAGASLMIMHVARTTSFGYYNGTSLSMQTQKPVR